jgi:SAM-dependent methyltransferase
MRHFFRNTIFSVPFVLLLLSVVFCAAVVRDREIDLSIRLRTGGFCVALLFLAFAAYRTRDRWWRIIKKGLERHTDYVDAIPDKHITGWIILASALGLYMELLIIRWHASCFGLFAHFKNVSLLSCFLGLGIGYAIGRRRPLTTPLLLPALSVQVVGLHILHSSPIRLSLGNPIAEQAAHGLTLVHTAGQKALLYPFLAFVFLFNVLNFVPLGQLTSRLMLRRSKLVSYGWNLIGSLLGVGLFSLLSFAWSPPSTWIFLGTVGVVIFLHKSWGALVSSAVCMIFALAVLAVPSSPDLINAYSPYQIISLHLPEGQPARLLVNHAYHQRILDLSSGSQSRNPHMREYAAYYELPYLFKPAPERVLVVGSGTGNDVAAALRCNARYVDAVEIDPVILYYGKTLHPEMPYKSEKVTSIVNDARTFIRKTNHRYDMIVYGLLDAHTLLSGRSNVRLDSFVYTVEAFREARRKLKDDGIISMSFSVFSTQHGRKLFVMLKEAFDGDIPRVYRSLYDYSFTFVIGPGMDVQAADRLTPFEEVTHWFDDERIVTEVSTDDWPFFYMPTRAYPLSYVVMILVLLLVSLVSIRQIIPAGKESFSVPCFFLGAGFMLIETKGITELALTYGNTWMVISAVIVGILIMAFLANLFVIKFGPPSGLVVYGLLACFLFAGMFISGANLTFLPLDLDKIVLTAILTAPLFFSGMAFSSELDQHSEVPAALSSNLLGAMVGGFLEYNAMYFGFRSLYVIALAMYALAFFWSGRNGSNV